jgi:hypothetical protein
MGPMKFQSGVVVDTLIALERQLADHREPLTRMIAELTSHRYAPALEAAEKVRYSLAILVTLYHRLHANVVLADGMGPVESVGELALRGRRMVILTELGHLRDLLCDCDADARARGWFVGQFQNIDDVLAYAQVELAKIVAICARQPQRLVAEAPASANRTALYYSTVGVAQRALSDLRDDPDFAYFLRTGHMTAGWPEAAAAFRRIDAALAVHIDVESIGPPPVPLPPSRIADATPPRER